MGHLYRALTTPLKFVSTGIVVNPAEPVLCGSGFPAAIGIEEQGSLLMAILNIG